MPTHYSKVKSVSRLLTVANCLLHLNNFFSLKAITSGVRGMLNQASPSALSWTDMSYTDLKHIAEFSALLDREDEYRAYRESIEKCDKHAIPILFLHERMMKSNLRNNNRSHDIGEVRKEMKSFLYFDMEMNRHAAQEVANAYYCFVRR